MPPSLSPAPAIPGKIDLQECFAKAWECYKANFGMTVAATLIVLAISFLLQVPMGLAQFALEAASKDAGLGALTLVGWGIYVFFWAISSAAVATMPTFVVACSDAAAVASACS